MAVLRFIASLFLLVAVVAFIADATALFQGTGSILGTSFQQHWQDVAPGTFAAVKAAIQSATGSLVWGGIIAPLIALPTYLLFGLLAVVSGYFGRRREKINIFVN